MSLGLSRGWTRPMGCSVVEEVRHLWNVRWEVGMSVGVAFVVLQGHLVIICRARRVCLASRFLVTRARVRVLPLPSIDPFFLPFFYPFDTEAPELPNTILHYKFE